MVSFLELLMVSTVVEGLQWKQTEKGTETDFVGKSSQELHRSGTKEDTIRQKASFSAEANKVTSEARVSSRAEVALRGMMLGSVHPHIIQS